MNIKEALSAVVAGQDLAFAEMREVMRAIMSGETTPAQIAGLLIALRLKGETVDEITAAASVMRELSLKVKVHCAPLIDTCGTGGDATGTFNISTAAVFVCAAAGAYVAKHGNRSVSSASGSADLLEAAGANIQLAPERIAQCIQETGVGFMFAPSHHGATRHAAGPRRELGVRTLFNLLGPLTNPADARIQLLGIYAPQWVEKSAEVLARLGVERALVVHAEDGLDEISIGAPTLVAELKDGEIRSYRFTPEEFGLQRQSIAGLKVADAQGSLAVIREVFDNQPGPARDIVAVNAGAALYLCDLAASITEGCAEAMALIASGAVKQRFEQFIAYTQTIQE